MTARHSRCDPPFPHFARRSPLAIKAIIVRPGILGHVIVGCNLGVSPSGENQGCIKLLSQVRKIGKEAGFVRLLTRKT